MKIRVAIVGIVLALAGLGYADESKDKDLHGMQSFMPEGMAGSFAMQKAKVEKVFSAEKDGGRYRSYQVKWEDQEVVIADMFGSTNYEAGDEISFMVQILEMPIKGKKTKMIQFVMLDFSAFDTHKDKSCPHAAEDE